MLKKRAWYSYSSNRIRYLPWCCWGRWFRGWQKSALHWSWPVSRCEGRAWTWRSPTTRSPTIACSSARWVGWGRRRGPPLGQQMNRPVMIRCHLSLTQVSKVRQLRELRHRMQTLKSKQKKIVIAALQKRMLIVDDTDINTDKTPTLSCRRNIVI